MMIALTCLKDTNFAAERCQKELKAVTTCSEGYVRPPHSRTRCTFGVNPNESKGEADKHDQPPSRSPVKTLEIGASGFEHALFTQDEHAQQVA
eukprot:1189809-Prorocentrum_minimum.AAC.5